MTDLEKAANNYLTRNHPTKGPCLIPNPGVSAVSCHENDFCECEMGDAFAEGFYLAEAEIKRLRQALEEIIDSPQDHSGWIARNALEGEGKGNDR